MGVASTGYCFGTTSRTTGASDADCSSWLRFVTGRYIPHVPLLLLLVAPFQHHRPQ